MSDNMFLQAVRKKLRWDSAKGYLTAEDLFDLPLRSTVGGPNLDNIAIALDKKIKEGAGRSFVDDTKSGDATLQLKFDIVMFVINEKKAENKRREEATAKAARNQRILQIMSEKQDDSLKAKTLDELQKLLDEDGKSVEAA
jgi:hypothetical protein